MIGTLLYLLILMFFDSIDMLADNFFSREVLFVVGLTYLVFEINRLVIVVFNAFLVTDKSLLLRIFLQYFAAIIFSAAAISGSLFLYFGYIEGFSTIRTELITFNALFLFVTIFYHLFFFSLVYLNRQNVTKIEKEEVLRENLDLELQSFKNQINPDLLFQSLEIIISALHANKKSADQLIDDLSTTYRYTLDNKHNDLVSLKSEIASLAPLSNIFKTKYPKAFSLQLDTDPRNNMKNIIPGTLHLLLENALSENIISDTLPLNFRVKSDQDALIIEYALCERLSGRHKLNKRLDILRKAYLYYSTAGIETSVSNGIKEIRIPMLEIEED